MEYRQVTFSPTDESLNAILIAELAEESFEGFEEQESALIAFIDEGQYKEDVVAAIALQHELQYEVKNIPQQNWNAEWEANFQPVVVQDFCTIRADFHQLDIRTPYEIIITPKMSFGTGHHSTTQLMIQMMKDLPLDGAKVLDFGTGTGILAILAEKLGAAEVTAIDNDEWSYTNTEENIERNNASTIQVQLGSLEIVAGQQYDIILANINRHILLAYMQQLQQAVSAGGKVLMSGLLTEDREIIVQAAGDAGLKLESEDMLNNWITLLFLKL
ncbi:MAG: 50S ribosomal protein L11 methyltransferase [Sphingobacteriales bacterium]|nr:MAG: 50S ribosomal protein L11 methyltransferase [Sphingobacteriales bacterium]